MRIHAISVIQNEADIIRENLEWARRFCERIWVWDLASTDRTWDILQSMRSEQIIPIRQDNVPFVNSVKGRLYNSVRDQIAENDWIYILDADEFIAEPPQPALEAAEREGANIVGGWQVDFYPTDSDMARARDMGMENWLRIPMLERQRYYHVEWFELRFVRKVPGLVWDTTKLWNDCRDAEGRPLKLSRRTVNLLHYRHRTPAQVALRHVTRMDAQKRDPSQFIYDLSGDFEYYVRPAHSLCHWPPGQAFHVPWQETARSRAAYRWARAVKAIRRRLPRKST